MTIYDVIWQYMTQNGVCMTHNGNWVLHTEGLTHFQINLFKTLCIQDSKYPLVLASDWSVYPDNGLWLVSLPRYWPLIGLGWHQMQGSTKFEWVSSASVSPLTMVKWYAPGFSLVRSGHHWLLIGWRSRIMLCKLWKMQNNILCWMKNY